MMRSLINWSDQLRQKGIARVLQQMLDAGPLTLLDMGCGHGNLAKRLQQSHSAWKIQGVAVLVQPHCSIPVVAYDGVRIPFPDDAFDVVLCIDMLHHTEDPECLLQEAARVARQWVLVKDHIAESHWDHSVLTGLDWLGNVGTGVALPYHFLSSDQWRALFSACQLEEIERRHPIHYWPGILGHMLDRQYHFISKLKVPSQ